MLQLTQKNSASAFWFEARAESGSRTTERLSPPLLLKSSLYHAHKIVFLSF